jgi:DNA-binding GntR family transcriptional regulator
MTSARKATAGEVGAAAAAARSSGSAGTADEGSAAVGVAALRIDRSSTVQRVAAALRASLFDGSLRPGTPLREAELAASLAVARSTVREALAVLVAENLLTRLPHRGVTVKVLDAAAVDDLYRARRVVEGGALASATPERLGGLRAALDRYRGAARSDDRLAVNEAHLAFHRAIVDLAGSPRLSALADGLLADLRLALAAAEREAGDAEQQVAEHGRLLDLLAEGRVDEARAALERHLGG